LTHEIETLWYRAPEILLGCKKYSLGVDIWAVGCIFAEMVRGEPFFLGDSEIDQIFQIFKIFGTPNEQHHPEILEYPEFKLSFPKFKPKEENFSSFFEEKLSREGIDLLNKMLELNPKRRITAFEALNHPYFKENFSERVEI
jgi:serine/threonine protein kinase